MDGLTPEKTIEILKQALQERDQTLQALKVRTKAFVDGLKLEKQALEERLETQGPQLEALQKQVTSYNAKFGPLDAEGRLDESKSEALLSVEKELESVAGELQKERASVRQLGEELSLAKQQNVALMTQLADTSKKEQALSAELEGTKRRVANLQEEMTLSKQQQAAMLQGYDEKMQREAGEREATLRHLRKQLEELQAKAQEEHETLRGRLTKLQGTLEGEREMYSDLERQVEASRLELSKASTQREELEGKWKAEREGLKREIEAMRTQAETPGEGAAALAEIGGLKKRIEELEGEAASLRAAGNGGGKAQEKAPPAPVPDLIDFMSSPLPMESAPADSDPLGMLPTHPLASPPLQPVASPSKSMPVVHVVGLSEAPSPASTASPALEEAQARVREVEEAKAAAEKALQAQIDDLKKQLEHAGSQEAARAKEQQDQVQELQAEAAKLRKQLDERPMIDVPAAVKEESPKESAEVTELQARVKSLEEELAGVRKASDEAAAKAKEEVQRLKTELEKAVEVETRAGMLLTEARKAVADKQEEEDKLKAQLNEAKMKTDKLEQEVKAAKDEKSSLALSVQMVSGDKATLIDEAATLRKERDEIREQLQTKSTALVSLEEAYQKSQREAAELQKTLKEVERSRDDKIATVQREAEETVRRIKSDAETELASARFQVKEAAQAQVMMEKSVSSMNAQVEALRRSITQATKETDELTRQKAEVIAELASERENAQERRRQMKVYLETLTKEKSELETELKKVEGAAAEARKAEASTAQALQELQERLAAQVGAGERHAQELEAQLRQKDEAYQQLKAERDAEVSRLRDEQAVRLDSTAKKSEQIATFLQVAEAEKAEHLAKRLAARNEMIGMAEKLEEATGALRTVDHSLHFTLVPRALEQIAVLEHAIVQVDEAVRSLTNHATASSNGSTEMRRLTTFRSAAGRFVNLGPSDLRSTSHELLMSPNSSNSLSLDDSNTSMEMSGESKMAGGLEDEEAGAGGRRSKSNSVGGKAPWIERIDKLDLEMERVSTGLSLLGQSVEKLSDAVLTNQQGPWYQRALRDCVSFLRHHSGGIKPRSPAYSSVHLDEPASPDRRPTEL